MEKAFEAVSTDELLSDLNNPSSLYKDERQVVKSTSKNISGVVRKWEAFTKKISKEGVVPNMRMLQVFCKLLAKGCRGTISKSKHVSFQSIETYLYQLPAALETLNIQLPKGLIPEVAKAINPDLISICLHYTNLNLKWLNFETTRTQLQLSRKQRPKPIVLLPDLEHTLRFLWTEDDHHYETEHSRVQLAFYIVLLIFSAARMGAVVVSDGYRGSNECLKYRDFTLQVSRNSDGLPDISIMVNLNLRKGERGLEDKAFKMPLYVDYENPYMCPVLLFLSIALHSGALDTNKIEGIFNSELAVRDVKTINFNRKSLDLPVLTLNNSTQALSYSSANAALQGVFFRMGYEEKITSYALRRSAINSLTKKVPITRILQIVGHKRADTILKYYLGDTADVEMQDVVLDRPTIRDRLSGLRGLSGKRFPGAPHNIRITDMYQELRNHPEYIEQRKIWQDLKERNFDPKVINAAHQKAKRTLERLRKDATIEYRQSWIDEIGSRFLESTPEITKKDIQMHPLLRRVVDVLFPPSQEKSVPSQERSVRLMLALYKLCSARSGRQVDHEYPCLHVGCEQKCKKNFAKEFWCSHEGCSYTEEPFTSLRTFREHAQTPPQDSFRCPQEGCKQKPFKNRAKFEIHCKKHERVFFCSYEGCNRTQNPFLSLRSFREHIDRLTFQCSHQGCKHQPFKNRAKFEIHYKKHEKVYFCSHEGCPHTQEPFSSMISFRQHVNSHSPKKFLCLHANCKHRPFLRLAYFEAHCKKHETDDVLAAEQEDAATIMDTTEDASSDEDTEMNEDNSSDEDSEMNEDIPSAAVEQEGAAFFCPYSCNEDLFSFRAFMIHQFQLHGMNNLKACPLASCRCKEALDAAALVEHIHLAHNEMWMNQELCPLCFTSFCSREEVERHCSCVHLTADFICPFQDCDRNQRAFITPRQLADHLWRVHETVARPEMYLAEVITQLDLTLP